MPARPPVPFDADALTRPLDRAARGLLLEDTPNYWSPDRPALSNLAYASVLQLSVFDRLAEVNKAIVVSRVAHLLDTVQAQYLRKTPPPEPRPWHFSNFPVLYVDAEETWTTILAMASRPGADGGTATDTAAQELCDFLEEGIRGGRLVPGHDLEQCLEHGRRYLSESSCYVAGPMA